MVGGDHRRIERRARRRARAAGASPARRAHALGALDEVVAAAEARARRRPARSRARPGRGRRARRTRPARASSVGVIAVAALGAVERDPRDALGDLVEHHRLIAHGGDPTAGPRRQRSTRRRRRNAIAPAGRWHTPAHAERPRSTRASRWRCRHAWLTATGKLNVPHLPAQPRAADGQGRHGAGAAADDDRPALGPAAHGAGAVPRPTASGSIVIGSNAGNERAPAWSLQPARPTPTPRSRSAASAAACARASPRARSARELWRKMNEQYEGFDAYDANDLARHRRVRARAALSAARRLRPDRLGVVGSLQRPGRCIARERRRQRRVESEPMTPSSTIDRAADQRRRLRRAADARRARRRRSSTARRSACAARCTCRSATIAEFETGNLTLSMIDAEKMGLEHHPQQTEIALHVDDVQAARKTLEAARRRVPRRDVRHGRLPHGVLRRSRRQRADAAPPLRAAQHRVLTTSRVAQTGVHRTARAPATTRRSSSLKRMLFTRKQPNMVDAESALPGREQEMPVPAKHEVLGTPLKGPFPEGVETAIFGMGCFWGAERIFWEAPRRLHDRGRLRGRLHAEPDLRGGLQRAHRPHRGRARRLRPAADELRGDAEAVLGGPRPDPGHAPGQRRRHAVPLGDLLARRGAARRRRGLARGLPGDARRRPATARSRPRSPTAGPFYYAEDYHQQYLAKNPNGYCGLGGTGVSCPIGLVAAIAEHALGLARDVRSARDPRAEHSPFKRRPRRSGAAVRRVRPEARPRGWDAPRATGLPRPTPPRAPGSGCHAGGACGPPSVGTSEG